MHQARSFRQAALDLRLILESTLTLQANELQKTPLLFLLGPVLFICNLAIRKDKFMARRKLV